MYRAFSPVHIWPNATKLIGWLFITLIDNDPKLTKKATRDFLKAKKFNIVHSQVKSPDPDLGSGY